MLRIEINFKAGWIMKVFKTAAVTVLFMIWALNAVVVERTYYFDTDKFSAKKTSDGYDLIKLENTMNTAPAGEPALPYASISMMLPPGEKADAIEIIFSGKTELPGSYSVYPQQHARPYSEGRSGSFAKKENIYRSENIYPESKNGQLTTHYLNGHSFALSAFTPAEYIPASGKLSIYRKATVRISTSPDGRSLEALKNLKLTQASAGKVIDLDQNGGELLSSYKPLISSKADGSYDYLIITGDAFKRNFDVLTNFYASRGIESKIVSVNTIYTGTTGRDSQEKIRNFIISEYQAYGIEFVLLAGDVELVPARGFYCSVQSSSVYTDSNIPSDLYYSALDGTWNDDNDEKWGEIGEDDLLPELSIARFSVSDTTELNNMINKTVKYQGQPVLGKLRDPLMAGEKLYGDPESWGADYLELLIGYREDNGYTTTGIPEDHNITRLYDKNSVWSKEDLITEINKGHSFIHHDGHSNYTYNMRMNNTDVTNANFSNINGVTHNYTLVNSSGCMSGGFDYNDCIGEKFTVIENLAVAYIGNSRYGWFNEGQTEGPSIHLHREFADALYGNRKSPLGTAHKESKIDTAPWVNAPGQWEEGALRWCFYDCNVLGDAALNIWTDEPENLTVNYSNAITIGQTDFELDVKGTLNHPLTNILCAVIQNGAVMGKAYTDDLGNATIALDPSIAVGSASLVVSGYNTLKAEYPLDVISNEGKYIVIDSYRISSGGDDVIEFGETAEISITFKNVGLTGAVGLEMDLTEADGYIELAGTYLNIGALNAGDTLRVDGAFTFTVAENVPDLHNFDLNSVISDSEEQWTRVLKLTAKAAIIEIVEVGVSDGGNNALDPGETADLVISYKNRGHAKAVNLSGTLSSDDPKIAVSTPVQNLPAINPGETASMSYGVTASVKATAGYVAAFVNSIEGERGFTFEDSFNFMIGAQTEDFETGDFSSFNWYSEGDKPWFIDAVTAYAGAYSARSGAIGDDQKTALVLSDEVLIDGNISFYVKTSTEGYFDPLIFYIDGMEVKRWDYGILDWHLNSFPVSAGNHTFKWSFEKDEMEGAGEDCVWLDNITFPGIRNATGISEDQITLPSKTTLYQNYPNPFNPETVITYALTEKAQAEISVYNLKGELVSTIVNMEHNPGRYSVRFRGDDLNSGVYFFKLSVNGKTASVRKMLLVK
jgi:hypothetical protein